MSNHDWINTGNANKNNTHRENRSTHIEWDAGNAWNPQAKKQNEYGRRNTDLCDE